MNRFSRRFPQWTALSLVAVLVAGCQKGDVIAPDGATISLTATPAQIVLEGGLQKDPVIILATVFNSIGAPLPGQDVRFTTSSGLLDPPAGTPVRTDRFGNATTVLTGATTGPQINARSGKATAAALTLNAASGILSSITLSLPKQTIDACSDTYALTAMAADPSGNPIKGVTIIFDFGQTGGNFVLASFNPIQGISDATGEVTSTLDLNDNDCTSKCVGKTCDGVQIKAHDQSGTVSSLVITIRDAITP